MTAFVTVIAGNQWVNAAAQAFWVAQTALSPNGNYDRKIKYPLEFMRHGLYR